MEREQNTPNIHIWRDTMLELINKFLNWLIGDVFFFLFATWNGFYFWIALAIIGFLIRKRFETVGYPFIFAGVVFGGQTFVVNSIISAIR